MGLHAFCTDVCVFVVDNKALKFEVEFFSNSETMMEAWLGPLLGFHSS